MIKEFSSIHTHSHFSVMDGISLPQEMLQAAKDKGLRSIAITDHGHAHAHADFYLHGKKLGVRTIFGVEAYVIDSLDAWKQLKEAKDESDEDATNTGSFKAAGRKGHLVILACNREGLSNLYQLIYLAHRDGFYGKPRMDKAMLRALSRGLVASSACMGGVVSNKAWELQRGECAWEDVVRQAREFDDIFGRGRFFLELQLNESASQRYINGIMVRLHEETGIPLSVTVDAHYVHPEDWAAQELLYMLRDKKTVSTRGDDWNFEIKQLYIKSPEEMWRSYVEFGKSHIPEHVIQEAFENTLLIDSLVEEYEPDTHVRLPRVIGTDEPFKELGRRCIEGLKREGWDRDEKYARQLLHELRVIKDKGFANYFLIIQTMVREAKKEMLVGPGRGSAAASLVCRTLGITDLNPIKLDLMFERFLDPDRKELPDIDLDFEDPDRVVEILSQLYGDDNVACLSTYGTFQIKGLMKDIARVYDLDHNEINQLNKKIEAELKVLYTNQGPDKVIKDKSMITVTLEDVERVSPTFNEFCAKYPMQAQYFKRLYGRNKYVGCHASAIVIGDDLPAETAVFKARNRDTGALVTQASFTEGIVNKNLSAMGFVKFDVLGLATLRVIHHAIDLVAAKLGKLPSEVYDQISGDNLDLDDQKVLQHVFWQGNFAGIFQFTEKGIRKVARGIKPNSFKDISAIAALYRPGPLGSGMHKIYAGNKRKYQAGELKFDHPILKEIMEPTYGCLVYQEQMLQMGGKLGKLSGPDVQRLRKLLLKKDKSKSDEWLKQEKQALLDVFKRGCLENGYPQGDEAWKMMEKFGGYGFNKAHSDAYSKVTMQTAWLATYHPLEFYSALLTRGQSGDLQDYVSDIKKSGIKVLPVDINDSGLQHRVREKAIRLALTAVKGVGKSAAEKIVAGQPYADLFDFLRRSKASKTAVLPLIYVGAFDSLCENLHLVEALYGLYLSDDKHKGKKWDEYLEKCKGYPTPEDYPLHEKVAKENELMGFSVRGSPFEILGRKQKIEAMGDAIDDYAEFIGSTKELGTLPVVIKDFKERAQRNKKMMAFVKFGAATGEEFESPVFAGIWEHVAARIRKGNVYLAIFNRKLDEPENLVLGYPGWRQSSHSANQALISVDEIEVK